MDWGLNYSLFVGYFAVEPKEGGMYSSSIQQPSTAILPLEWDEHNPALSLLQIEFIEKGMSIGEIRGQIGLPQKIVGSGIGLDVSVK